MNYGEVILWYIVTTVADAIAGAVEDGIKFVIEKAVDETGRVVSQLIQKIDTDGDGVYDSEVVIYELGTTIPDLDGGYCIVEDRGTIGIGLPSFQIVDGATMVDYVYMDDPFDCEIITGNADGYMLDMDHDGDNDDAVVPLQDFNGDFIADWGWVQDTNDNGIPDASKDAPFYAVGSQEYMDILKRSSNIPSIVVMSADGTMTVYDTNGNITAEDCDTAYSLWVSKNGIMSKPIADYSVTEGILLVGFIVGGFGLIRKIFRRKRVG